MAIETVLQHEIFVRFALPFLLVFLIVYAILEMSKILGENHQVNALLAFVVGLIMVSVSYPTEVVSNMILFLTVAIVVMFVALLMWGFITSGEFKGLDGAPTGLKWVLGIGVVVATVIALFWATGSDTQVFNLLFKQTWSNTLWTNIIFVVVIVVALATVIKSSKD